MKHKTTIITAVILYLISTGISYATFSFLNSGPSQVSPIEYDPETGLAIDPSAPRTEACPLNGKMFTQVEREAWDTKRPLAVLVENSPDARPHSGIIRADIVYEAVAEGGVTRFMPIFYCDAQASDVIVAPVRSVRTYFIDWASEYGKTPLFAHVGGANCSAEQLPNGSYSSCKTDPRAQALEQLAKYGWRHVNGNNLDQFSIGAPTYLRKPERTGHTVATEHSVVASTQGLWQVGEDRGWTNLDPEGRDWTKDFQLWQFKDDPQESDRGVTTTIGHDFWEGYKQFDARWEYDRQTNTYNRFTGGEPHMDLETGKQLNAKNVVVLFTQEITNIDELKHILYTTIGDGQALIFQDGQVIDGYWEKDSRTDRTIFTNKKGEPVSFTRGRIWISVVANGTNVNY